MTPSLALAVGTVPCTASAIKITSDYSSDNEDYLKITCESPVITCDTCVC